MGNIFGATPNFLRMQDDFDCYVFVAGYHSLTAHHVKFPDVVEEAIGEKLPVPEEVKPLFEKEKKSELLEADYEVFKEWMMGK